PVTSTFTTKSWPWLFSEKLILHAFPLVLVEKRDGRNGRMAQPQEMMADAGEPEHQTRGLPNVRAARPEGPRNSVPFDGCKRRLAKKSVSGLRMQLQKVDCRPRGAVRKAG